MIQGMCSTVLECHQQVQAQTMETVYSMLRALAIIPGPQFQILVMCHELFPMLTRYGFHNIYAVIWDRSMVLHAFCSKEGPMPPVASPRGAFANQAGHTNFLQVSHVFRIYIYIEILIQVTGLWQFVDLQHLHGFL